MHGFFQLVACFFVDFCKLRTMNWKSLSRRRDQAERAIASNLLSQDSTEKLLHYNSLQDYLNLGIKASTLGMVYFLHRRKFFKRHTPFFIKELTVVGFLIGYMAFGELLVGQFVWKNVKDEVREYGRIKEKEFSEFSAIRGYNRLNASSADDAGFIGDE